MINSKINTALAALTVSAALASAPVYAATDAAAKEAMDKRIAEGKELAFSRSQGNCLACHNIMNASGNRKEHLQALLGQPWSCQLFVLVLSKICMTNFGHPKEHLKMRHERVSKFVLNTV